MFFPLNSAGTPPTTQGLLLRPRNGCEGRAKLPSYRAVLISDLIGLQLILLTNIDLYCSAPPSLACVHGLSSSN